MDNRTPFRPRSGPAHYVDLARRALGVAEVERPLARVPLPLVPALTGAVAVVVALLARPQAVGHALAAVLGAGATVLVVAALVRYDRAAARAGDPGGGEVAAPAAGTPAAARAAALPVAALLGLAVLLAGTDDRRVVVTGMVAAGLVVTGAPLLAALRASSPRRLARVLQDAAGVAAMVPVVAAASATGLPLPARLATLGAGALLSAWDATVGGDPGGGAVVRRASSAAGAAVRSVAPVPSTRAAAAALAVAAATAGAALPALGPGVGAAAGAPLLALWYGLRGAALQGATGSWSRAALAEYAVFTAAAAALLTAGGRAL